MIKACHSPLRESLYHIPSITYSSIFHCYMYFQEKNKNVKWLISEMLCYFHMVEWSIVQEETGRKKIVFSLFFSLLCSIKVFSILHFLSFFCFLLILCFLFSERTYIKEMHRSILCFLSLGSAPFGFCLAIYAITILRINLL